MARIRTSIYVDKELWEKFKLYAARRGIKLSNLLEELIQDEVVEALLDNSYLDMDDDMLDFEPVVAKDSISDLLRLARGYKVSSILHGQ